MTYQTVFKKIKEKFENIEVSELNDMAIQFTLSDEDCGGTFYAEVKNGNLYVEPYDYRDNDAVVDVTKASLYKILDGKLSVEKAIDDGELTVKGDLEKIKSIAGAKRKPEAAKTEVKEKAKAEVKAEPAKETACAAKAEPAKKAACAAKTEAKAEVKAPAAKAPAAKAPAAKCSRTKKTAAKKATK